MQDLKTFFKKHASKYYREEKQDFERFLIFLNIKMSVKSKKIELSEEFMAMWREEHILLDFLRLIFSKKFYFKCEIFFSLPRIFLNFCYVFKLPSKLHWLADTQRRYSCLYNALSSYGLLMTLQWCLVPNGQEVFLKKSCS